MTYGKLDEAIRFAAEMHKGQTDKAGQPYVLHLLAVMAKMDTEEERVVAVLHDVLEDTDADEGAVRHLFGHEVARCVRALTRTAGETYDAYVERVAASGRTVCKVKLADLEHNMDPRRPKTEGSGYRLAKYQRAYTRLREVVDGRQVPESSCVSGEPILLRIVRELIELDPEPTSDEGILLGVATALQQRAEAKAIRERK